MNTNVSRAMRELAEGLTKVNYYSIADMWSDFVIAQSKTGLLDILAHNPLFQRFLTLGAIPFGEYPKQPFGIKSVVVGGVEYPVLEEVVRDEPFVELRRFSIDAGRKRRAPLLLVAPLSGHHATLLRETVATVVQDFDVYITDWKNARDVHMKHGEFGLTNYVHTVRAFIEYLGVRKSLRVMAVCQPAPAVFAAVSLQAQSGGVLPSHTVLMGGPIDARMNPTAVNRFAQEHSLEWFADRVIQTVTHRYEGHGREVYPGFLQLAAFMAVDPDRHVDAEAKYRRDRLLGDIESANRHARFYREYRSVIDLPGTFFLDTVRDVFQECLLPRGLWELDGVLVDPSRIKHGKLLTVEGELDNIVGLGQTEAALALASGLSASQKMHYVANGVGHYGIFSGRVFRMEVYPQAIRPFLMQK